MNRYRCLSTAKFGPGQVLQLTPGQINPRRHVLDVPKDYDGKNSCKVSVTGPVEFKAGEIIGLPELDRRHVEVLVPVAEAKTETEKLAVSKAAEVKANQVKAAAKGNAA
jgi:hypothetical protein